MTRLGAGDENAANRLLPVVYDELRQQARRYLDRQPAGQSLAPTGLVHEAFLKIAGSEAGQSAGREKFLALAAKAMREILVDHARRRSAEKRGGGWHRITLRGVETPDPTREVDVLALDAALATLQEIDPRGASIVEQRFFGEMSVTDIATNLGISRATAHRDLAMAMAWLLRAIDEDGDGGR